MAKKPLQIFNASAGSGKTYSLVKNYILLLLQEKGNPFKFSEILAMTFTNKAAFEMKSRVVEALDTLSSFDKQDEKGQKYCAEIAKESGLSIEQTKKNATKILSSILHRYEDFHIKTIDRFNVRLIRAFSLDLDIPSDHEIVVNEDLLFEQTIDKILNKTGGDKQLTSLIVAYSKSQLEEEDKWDFQRNLTKFAEILVEEKNIKYVEQLLESDFSTEEYQELKSQLFTTEKSIEKILLACREKAMVFESEFDKLPGKSRTSSKIYSLGKIVDYKKTLFTDTVLKDIEKSEFPEELKTHFREAYNYFEERRIAQLRLQKYLQNYFNMALLKEVARELEITRTLEKKLRLSEFDQLIASLISHETAPFIYEKIGSKFKHFLLDEFQDTSRLQWLNLTPLVHESISNYNKCLIVGDPKQSIYRFRNGVAEQFVALPKLYNPEHDEKIAQKSAFFDSLGEKNSLENNWRSAFNIVAFNNTVFSKLKDALPTNGKDFYESIIQIPKNDSAGYLCLHSKNVSKQKQKPSKEEIYQEQLSNILNFIEEAEKDGFQRGEICILGRKGGETRRWANQLTEKGYKVVSADSLIVDNNSKVQLILLYFKLRATTRNENIFLQFAEQYCTIKGFGISYFRNYFINPDDTNSYSHFDQLRFIEDHFQSEEEFYFYYESLYNLVELCFAFFELDELKSPYLHHFADMTHQYEQENGPDIQAFLENYSSLNKTAKSVQIPKSNDALQVMTIHKSKGLEFPCVILPNMDYSTESSNSKFLIPSDSKLLYASTSKKSSIPEIKKFSELENSQVFMDMANLFYVAFTRAVERLYILNINGRTGGEYFGKKMHAIFTELEGIEELSEGQVHFKSGTRQRSKKKDRMEDHYFYPTTSTDNLWFPDIAMQDKEELTEEDYLSDERRYGNQFHALIEKIHAEDEIAPTLQRMIQEGIVDAHFEKELQKDLEDLFHSSAYLELFNGADAILNEQDIIVAKDEILRPDKIILKKDVTIVVDYKTGMPNKKNERQVRNYHSILSEMGYKNVKGYLFYTSSNELQLVA